MLPGYRHMDAYPYPHYGKHFHYPHSYYPSWEAVPPQMKEDPIRFPASYEPWYGYPSKMDCHGYCNNVYNPGYCNLRPPYLHPQLPTHFYYHGTCPSYPEIYPAYYVHPPHYSMEQPRYEYDKNMHGIHCCGCPNHACNQKQVKENNKGVQIEEYDAETEQKDSGSSDPVNIKSNHPFYPFVWIPHEHMKNKDSNEIKLGQKSGKPSESEDWNRWFPLDMKNIRSLEQSGNEKKNENQNNEGNGQYPFPMIWLPAHDKSKDAEIEVQKKDNTLQTEELPAKLKVIPVSSMDSGRRDKTEVLKDALTGRVFAEAPQKEENPNQATVEQIKYNELKKSPEKTERTVKTIPVQQPHGREKKLPDKTVRKRSPSPMKSPMLPPVCLRVDPLPRRKNANGSSRSSSPPSIKAQQNSNEMLNTSKAPAVESKICEELSMKDPVQTKVGELKTDKDTVVVEIEDMKTESGKEESAGNGDHEKVNVPIIPQELSKVTAESENCEKENETKENNKLVEAAILENSSDERMQKMELSSENAAILIQSAYRGFVVRKWEPLKNLKQISKVREQVEDVRERIHALEKYVEVQKDEKQRVVIGEIIMGLLLQLDAVQGLHPSVRDRRKSVVRELVSLQEKLDSLALLKSEVVENLKLTNSEDDEQFSVNKDLEANLIKNPTKSQYVRMGEKGSKANGHPTLASVEPRKAVDNQDDANFDCMTFHKVNEVPKFAEKLWPQNVDECFTSLELFRSQQSKEVELHECEDKKADSVMKKLKVPSEERTPQNTDKVFISLEQLKKAGLPECEDKMVNSVVEQLEVPNEEEAPQNGVFRSLEQSKEAEMPECEVKKAKVMKQHEVPYEEEAPQNAGESECEDTKADSVMQQLKVPNEDEVSELGDEGISKFPEDVESLVAEKPAEIDASHQAQFPVDVVDELPPTPKSNSQDIKNMEFKKNNELASKYPFAMPLMERECKVPQLMSNLAFEGELEEPIVGSVGASSFEFGGATTRPQQGTEVVVEEKKDVKNTSMFDAKGMTDEDGGRVAAVEDIFVDVTHIPGETHFNSLSFEPSAIGSHKDTEVAAEYGNVNDTNIPQETKLADAVEGNEKIGHLKVPIEDIRDFGNSSILQNENQVDITPVENPRVILDPFPTAKNQADTAPAENPSGAASAEDEIPVGVASAEEGVSCGVTLEPKLDEANDSVLAEENEKLREMIEKLIQAGNQQLAIISDLNGRVKDLERKLVKNKKLKVRRHRAATTFSRQ